MERKPLFPNWRVIRVVLRDRLRLAQADLTDAELERRARTAPSIGDFFLHLPVKRFELSRAYWLSTLVLLLRDVDSDNAAFEHDYLQSFDDALDWAAAISQQWATYTRMMHVHAWITDEAVQDADERVAVAAKRLVEHFTWLMLYPHRPSREQQRVADESDRMEQDEPSVSEARTIRSLELRVPRSIRAQRSWLVMPFFEEMSQAIAPRTQRPYFIQRQVQSHWVELRHDVDTPYFFLVVEATAFAVPSSLDASERETEEMTFTTFQRRTYLYAGVRQWPAPLDLDLPQLILPIVQLPGSPSSRLAPRLEVKADGLLVIAYLSANERSIYRETVGTHRIDALYEEFNPLLTPPFEPVGAAAAAIRPDVTPKVDLLERLRERARRDRPAELVDILLDNMYNRMDGLRVQILDYAVVANNWVVVVTNRGLSVVYIPVLKSSKLEHTWLELYDETANYALREQRDQPTYDAIVAARQRLALLTERADPALIRVHLAAEAVPGDRLELLVGLDIAKVNPDSRRPLLFFRFVIPAGSSPDSKYLRGDAILFDANELHISVKERSASRARYAQLGRLSLSCGRLQLDMLVTQRGDQPYDAPVAHVEAEAEGEAATAPKISRLAVYLSWRAIFRNPVHAPLRYLVLRRSAERSLEIFTGLPDPETTALESLPAYDPRLPAFQQPLFAGQEYSLSWTAHSAPTQLEPGIVALGGIRRIDRLRHQRRVGPQRLLYELVHALPPPSYSMMSEASFEELSEDQKAGEVRLDQLVPSNPPSSRSELMFGSELNRSDAFHLASPLVLPDAPLALDETATTTWQRLNRQARAVRNASSQARLAQYSLQLVQERSVSLLFDEGRIPDRMTDARPTLLSYFDRAAPLLEVVIFPLDPELLMPAAADAAQGRPQSQEEGEEDVHQVPRHVQLSAIGLIF
jgi:hypothetical protein